MNDLYVMRYMGATGSGHGVLYVGKGVVLGFDVGEIEYKGSYREKNGRIVAEGMMTATRDDSVLVNGHPLLREEPLPFSAELPIDLDNGAAHQIFIAHLPVNVMFTKLGSLPA